MSDPARVIEVSADQAVLVERRRLTREQVPDLWRLEAREVGWSETCSFAPDQLPLAAALRELVVDA